jgi:AcrR family transcriptional regulator
MAMSTSPKTGRRPGATQTRDAIAEAARAQFAEAGYERATIRAIAQAAGVDPALVVHFFGAKEDLFRSVTEMPAAISDALTALADGPRETVGRRLAELVVTALENPASRAIVLARIRSASSHPGAAELVRETVEDDIGRLAAGLTSDRPELRAALVGIQVVGLAQARYVVGVEPIASISAADLVELLAPPFQRYLVESLA